MYGYNSAVSFHMPWRPVLESPQRQPTGIWFILLPFAIEGWQLAHIVLYTFKTREWHGMRYCRCEVVGEGFGKQGRDQLANCVAYNSFLKVTYL